MSDSSRLPGFNRLSLVDRQGELAGRFPLCKAELAALETGGLTLAGADSLIENVVGLYAMPFGLATNFIVNHREVLIPMVIEEPSVVAACSNAARFVRHSGGFQAEATDPLMIGQVQVLFEGAEPDTLRTAHKRIEAAREELLRLADEPGKGLVERGGGAREIEVREFPTTRAGPMLVVSLIMDTRDAMGANLVNTACERIAPRAAELAGGRVNLRILSNLSDRRIARARCVVTASAVGGSDIVRGIDEAQTLAEIDPYRAATHNKGIMNGIDAVAVATGNDWRALEAGAHAFACTRGSYGALSRWEELPGGDLAGSLELPLAVGIVGGMTRAHPVARLALEILGVSTAKELASIMAAVGLAQNLAALRALAAEGIQQGHMALHARRQNR